MAQANRINPLTWNTPIVDAKGRPSREFQIKWEQLSKAALAIPALSTPAAVSAVLDVLSGGAVNGSILRRSGGMWEGYPSPSNGAKFLAGNNPPTWEDVDDADLVLSDVLTNNVSTTKHGFAPKLPNDATRYLDGTGNYSVPAGGGGGGVGEPWMTPFMLRPTVAGATINAGNFQALAVIPSDSLSVSGVKIYCTAAGTSRELVAGIYSSVGLTMAGGTLLAQSNAVTASTGIISLPFTSAAALSADTLYWLGVMVINGSGNFQSMLGEVTRNSYMFFAHASTTLPATAPASTAGTGATQFTWWGY